MGVGRLHTFVHRAQSEAVKRDGIDSRPVPFTLSYSEQLAATIFPDSTRSAGALADGSFGSGVLLGSRVPVSSSFLPTWSLSAVGLAIRRYVCAVAASAGVAEAPVNTNFCSAGAPLVPATGGGVVPAVPAVPVGLAASADIGGAAFRQPVTTIFLSELDGVLCCGVAGAAVV